MKNLKHYFSFSKSKKKSNRRSKKRGPLATWTIRILNTLMLLFIVGVITGAGLFAYYVSSAPKLTEASLNATTSSLIYDKNENLIADLGSEKRTNVETQDIPTDLVNAIISIEDHRFFQHRGIDVVRIAGAFFNNLRNDNMQGGSTLTQQFIKLTYFSTSTADQTIKRKAQEAWLSLQLERRNTKQEILTYYVNKVYMANGYYGMQTAARNYYGKDLKDLSLPQLALLAGMPQAPNQYDPYTAPESAKSRRDTVLSQMLKYGYIDQAQYEAAIVTPVTDGLLPLSKEARYPEYMDNYLTEVISEVERETGYNLLETGLTVYTNVDSNVQEYLYNVYNTDTYVAYPDDELQVASTIIDVTNGHVIAQLGSRKDTENVSFGNNQAVNTDRDWGSTMKPITDYAPAIEEGVYTSTADNVSDSGPYYYPGTSTLVNNWDKQFYGNITVQAAIQYSRNIPAIKSLEAAGLDNALSFLNKLGINYPELLYSNAISSNTTQSGNEYGASSEKMAAAYAAFANGGTYYKPSYVNRVVFADKTEKVFTTDGTRAMSETTAYMMTDMMKAVLSYGTGTNAAISGLYQAGKTGTSNYSDDQIAQVAQNYNIYSSSVVAPDISFVGYNSQYAMAVWTGYKNRLTPVMDGGNTIATDVYKVMMSYLYELTGAGSTDFTMPDGVTRWGSYVYLNSALNNRSRRSYYSYEESSTSSSTTTETSTSSEKSETASTDSEEKETETSSIQSNSSTDTRPTSENTGGRD